jgi:hypothetical protein
VHLVKVFLDLHGINLYLNTVVKIGSNKTPKNSLNSKHNYTKVIIEDPYNNRDLIARVAKKQKGIYEWATLEGKTLYIGHSINLYNRIC